MGFKGALFLSLFGILCVVALAEPFAGVAAYLIHYHVGPEATYWGQGLAAAGVRFSLTISAFLALGTLLNWGKLRFGRLITGQEALLLIFLTWVLLSRVINGPPRADFGAASVDATEKLLKMAVFLLILTHVVTTARLFHRLFQVFVVCALYLGYEAFTAPPSAFVGGRLSNTIGGPDFTDSNALGAHLLILLAIVGVQLLRTGWKERFVCLAAAVLATNALIQTRSRGALLGAAGSLVFALSFAPKGKRRIIWGLTLCGLLGAAVLVDKNWLLRMETMEASATEQHEGSARSRLEVWKAALPLVADHALLGVGPSRFHDVFPQYSAAWGHRDAHNTYLRIAAELGLPGLALYGLLIVNAFRGYRRVVRAARGRPALADLGWFAFALSAGFAGYLVAGIFGSYYYLEMPWICLLLPAGLERALENAVADSHASGGTTADTGGAAGDRWAAQRQPMGHAAYGR